MNCGDAWRGDVAATGEDNVPLGPACRRDAPHVRPRCRSCWWCSHYYCLRRSVVRCKRVMPAMTVMAPMNLAVLAEA